MTEGGSELPRAVHKLQALIRIPTISHLDAERVDGAAFDSFLEELERQFPLLHERLELTRVHTHGLLFHWRGASADRPVVLMAHLDVVPVEGAPGATTPSAARWPTARSGVEAPWTTR